MCGEFIRASGMVERTWVLKLTWGLKPKNVLKKKKKKKKIVGILPNFSDLHVVFDSSVPLTTLFYTVC